MNEKDGLIVEQAMKIKSLEGLVAEHSKAKRRISQLLFSIGAPLNDNCLEFNKDQRKVLHEIARELDIN